MTVCSIPSCGKKVRSKGLCSAHYMRLRRNGDPLAGRTPNGDPQRYLQEVVFLHDSDECLIWPFIRDKDGYGRVNYDGRLQQVSRLLCERLHGPAPSPEHHAAHSCGKGHEGCVNQRHLSWKKPAENAHDKIAHGTAQRGERNPGSKLTEAQVREIRALKGSKTLREIAAIYGIHLSQVSNILRRKQWKECLIIAPN